MAPLVLECFCSGAFGSFFLPCLAACGEVSPPVVIVGVVSFVVVLPPVVVACTLACAAVSA